MYLLFVFITTVSGSNLNMHVMDSFDTLSDCQNYAPSLIERVRKMENIYDIVFECFDGSVEDE